MSISVERSYAFFALLVLPPVLLYVIYRYSVIVKAFGGLLGTHSLSRFMHVYKIRTFCFVFCWCMLVCAYAGISWGTVSVPVQRGGNAVVFVFDISHSMEAPDMPGRATRLSAASQYARMLLPKLKGNAVAVIVTKGDGIQMLPLTEDMVALDNLLANLSPNMSSAVGSSLGKGIKAAIRAFPANIAQKQSIWVFTDGDETDGALVGALHEAVTYGISVSIVGFGQEKETEVLAGDGVTKVKTALRSDRIQKSIESIQKNTVSSIRYIGALHDGSALTLLQDISSDTTDGVVGFETERVDRHGIFLVLALISFIVGCISNELDVSAVARKLKSVLSIGTVFTILVLFTSCRIDVPASTKILQSSWNWHQKKYRQATSCFLQAKENALEMNNEEVLLYARYGLGTTYIMMNEDAAAYDYFTSISEQAPDSLRFASFYNLGIIAYRKGDFTTAVNCFKAALRINNTNTNAKINLELAEGQMVSKRSQGENSVARSVSENKEQASLEENVLFSRIRESENKQWKNQDPIPQTSALDY